MRSKFIAYQTRQNKAPFLPCCIPQLQIDSLTSTWLSTDWWQCICLQMSIQLDERMPMYGILNYSIMDFWGLAKSIRYIRGPL